MSLRLCGLDLLPQGNVKSYLRAVLGDLQRAGAGCEAKISAGELHGICYSYLKLIFPEQFSESSHITRQSSALEQIISDLSEKKD